MQIIFNVCIHLSTILFDRFQMNMAIFDKIVRDTKCVVSCTVELGVLDIPLVHFAVINTTIFLCFIALSS